MARRGRLIATGAAAHRGAPAPLLRKLKLPNIESAWLAHVLGASHERALRAAVEAGCGVSPHVARTQKRCAGLTVAYRNPSRLGVDRWLAMLGLWNRSRRAFCVASAGTALTFDAVDARGRHRGGLIAPGLATAWNAVRGATRFELPPQASAYTDGLGTDTDACVRQGALYACAGLLERAAGEALGARYLGGGDAPALKPHLRGWSLKPHLVLEGLLAYAVEHA